MTTLRLPRYEHRQTGWAMLGLALVPFICLFTIRFLAPAADREFPAPLVPALCFASAIVVFGFSSLNVLVTATHVTFRFGVGLYRRSIALDRIRAVSIARSRWYEGWGIRWTRIGMLYNVGGFDAVRIDLVGGKTIRIGSDEADRLRAAIARAIDQRRARRDTAG